MHIVLYMYIYFFVLDGINLLFWKPFFKKFSLIHKAQVCKATERQEMAMFDWLLWDRNIQAGLITHAMMELQKVQDNMEAKSHGLLQIPHNNKP